MQAIRVKIALLADEYFWLRDIANELDISNFTVLKWVRKFALYGVRSLGDAPRPGVPRTHGEDKIAKDHQTYQHDRSFGLINTLVNQHHGSARRCVSFHGSESA